MIDEITRALSLRHDADDTICVCAFKRKKNGSGFYNVERFCSGVAEAADLVERSLALGGIGAIWTNLQRLKPGSAKRAKGESIDAYTNILVDIDRRHKTDADGNKVNATDDERAVLRVAAESVSAFLAKAFGSGVVALGDSGNGFHVSVPIEPLNPEYGQRLYSEILGILKAKFEDPSLNVEIDDSLADQTQVVTVWGTWNRKYPHTEERPQRQSKLLYDPRSRKPVTASQLELLCAENQALLSERKRPGAARKASDATKCSDDWLEKYGPEHFLEWGEPYTHVTDTYEKGGDTHYVLGGCLLKGVLADGTVLKHGGDARKTEFILFADGGFGLSCFSNRTDAADPSRDHGEGATSRFIKRLNALKGESYPYLIWPEEDAEELLRTFGVEVVSVDTPEPLESHKRTGLYAMPESCMYGYLGDAARKLQAPLGFAYPAVLAVYSVAWANLLSKGIRPNLYVCLIAGVHEGKSRTNDRAMQLVLPGDLARRKDTWGSSDAGLIEQLGGKKQDKVDEVERIAPAPYLLYEDEYIDAANKMDIKNSSLPMKFNRLFYKSHVEYAVKGKVMEANATVSLLTGVTVARPEDFSELWGKNTVSGLYDRFIFGWAPPGWQFHDSWEETAVGEQHQPKVPVMFQQRQWELYREWEKDNPRGKGRVQEIMKRVARLTTAANQEDADSKGVVWVTDEAVGKSLEFGEWQMAVRARYKPSSADTPGGKLAAAISDAYDRARHDDGTPKWVNWRDMYRKHGWNRDNAKDASGLKHQREALIDAKVLEAELEPDPKDESKFRRTGNYRYAD